jgi:predicted Zn-dependent protease
LVLQEFLDVCVAAYINNVIIFTTGSLEEHWQQVLQVLKKLEEAGLQLDINKYKFEQKCIKYLGYIIDSEQGIYIDPEKVKLIKAWEPPISVRGI